MHGTTFTQRMRAVPWLASALLLSSPSESFAAEEAEPLFVVILDDKRGFINGNGELVIEPRFRDASAFHDGLARVTLDSPEYQLGFIDKRGRTVSGPGFDATRDFSDGLAAVGFGEFQLHGGGDHRWGFIDTSGGLVIEPVYRTVGNFSDGLAAVLNDDGKWGYIDKSGNVVWRPSR